MSTTTTTDPSLVSGTLAEKREGMIVLTLPDSDYRLHLTTRGTIAAEVGKRVTGRIRAEALRVDIAQSGGRYIEPVYGRPRRVQGRIVATDPLARTITVRAACPVVCELTQINQDAAALPIGAIGTFDVRAGARFELVEAQATQPRPNDRTQAKPTGETPISGN